MEEEKAAAYYDELTRKGEGAARFKQGLGFSSGTDAVPERGSAIASSSSFLNQFVKASNSKSTENKDSEIRSIRDKLKKKPEDSQHPRVPDRSYRESSERRRYRSRERDERDKSHRRRSRSRSAERRSRYGIRERRRSRSRSAERHSRYGDTERRRSRRSRSRSKSSSPRREDVKEKKIDYSRLIKGYNEMSAAEKVKAKMKLQLDETAERDTSKGAGWERFEFDKDAPIDDEEIAEGTDDDAALVKRMGQSFRFSAIEAKREEQLKAAHDEAMFGAPTGQTPTNNGDDVTETTDVKDVEGESKSCTISLLGEKVLAKQQGSWRDRARKS